MKTFKLSVLLLFVSISQSTNAQLPKPAGVFLQNITWPEAVKRLNAESVIVIPLGAQAKAHGPHMLLGADFIQSEYFAREIAKTENIIVAPQLNYGFYFPFVKFHGSTSLRHSVAKNMVVDICRSLSNFGPKRFYVINEGIITNVALKPAAEILAEHGILLSFTDLTSHRVDSLFKSVQKQKEGGHADEIETSKVLYMQPAAVNMKLAKQDYGIRKGRGFPTPDSTEMGHYMPNAIWGDATLATKEKGEKITMGMLQIIRDDITQLRLTPLPAPVKYDYQAYIGNYQATDNKTVSVTDEGGLVITYNNLPKEKLYREGYDYFSGFYYEVWFDRNDAGEITNLRLVDVSGKTTMAKKQKQSD
jgi:creatinine amidohydrolase